MSNSLSNILFNPVIKQDIIEEDTKELKIIKNNSNCVGCRSNSIYEDDNKWICSDCGLILPPNFRDTENSNISETAQYTGISNSAGFRLSGCGRGGSGMIRTASQNEHYQNARKHTNFLILKETNKTMNLPETIIARANNMFDIIKRHKYVYRAKKKKSIQAAFVYFACFKDGIIRLPSEIAEHFGIENKQISKSLAILYEFHELGIINIEENNDKVKLYVERYFYLLGISQIYLKFVLKLLERIDIENINIKHDCKDHTNIVAAIYFLIQRTPSLRFKISKEDIKKKCRLSESTFERRYKILLKYWRKFVNTIIKYGYVDKKNRNNNVLLDSSWREKRRLLKK